MNNNEQNHGDVSYIYALVDPETKEIRYIGKSDDPSRRLIDHIAKANKEFTPHVYAWIRGLIQKQLKPELRILETASKQEIGTREAALIEEYTEAGYPLTNMAPGGEQPPVGSHTGHKHSDEARAKMSKEREKYSPEDLVNWGFTMKGRKHTQETKDLMSEQRKGNTWASGGKGKIVSEETRRKLSEANKGKKPSKATIEASKKPKSEEQKRQISETLSGRKQSPETIKKKSESLKKAHARKKEQKFEKDD